MESKIVYLLKTVRVLLIARHSSIGITGMCGVINNSLTISLDDAEIIMEYLMDNKPEDYTVTEYWWPVGELEPRLK